MLMKDDNKKKQLPKNYFLLIVAPLFLETYTHTHTQMRKTIKKERKMVNNSFSFLFCFIGRW
jgi:hypothetical protein